MKQRLLDIRHALRSPGDGGNALDLVQEAIDHLDSQASPGPYGSLHLGRGNFGEAIAALKDGCMVKRSGWNGKNMFLFIRPEDTLPMSIVERAVSIPRKVKEFFVHGSEETEVKVTAYICMKAADNTIVNGWLASQTDMIADDWTIIEFNYNQ